MSKLVLTVGLLLVLVGPTMAREHDWSSRSETRVYRAPELDWDLAAIPAILGLGALVFATYRHRR